MRMLADELRVISVGGLRWAGADPYNRDRFERVQRVAARLFAFTDTRPLEAVERSVFSMLTHVAPAPCGDAAIFDDDDRILLIQRADDRLWAMPGGAFEMGETAAQGVRREALEETGVDVEVVDLVGVYDSRFCENARRSSCSSSCSSASRSAWAPPRRPMRCWTSDGSPSPNYRCSRLVTRCECRTPSGSCTTVALSSTGHEGAWWLRREGPLR